MKPIELEIAGWGPYKGVERIDFTALGERGIFLITGPTGAGKTTVFDAITFALFGALSGQMREKSSVRSDFADGDTKTYVRLKMLHKGELYEILRNPEYMRPKKRKSGGKTEDTKERENAVLTLPDGSCIEGSSEVTRKVQDLLSMDYRQFKQISMIAQGEFARLLTENPAEKIRIFRELFGTERIETFTARMRTKANTLYKEVMEYRHRMDEDLHLLQEEEPLWKELIEAKESNYQEIFSFLKERRRAYREQLKAAEAEYEKKELEEKALSQKLLAMHSRNEKIEMQREKRQELEQLEKEGEEYKRREALAERIRRAERAEAEYIHYRSTASQLTESETSLNRLLAEEKGIEKKLQETYVFYRDQEIFQKLLQVQKERIDYESQLKEGQAELTEKQSALEKMRTLYLAAQEENRKSKEKLEQAEEMYRRCAIGIVAKMLEKGKDCPVCGAKEHPNPAQSEEGMPDEQELKRLREEGEKRQAKMLEAHEKALHLQAQAAALEEQIQEKERKSSEAEQAERGLTEQLKEKVQQSAEQAVLEKWFLLSGAKRQQALEEGRNAYQEGQTLLAEKKRQQEEIRTEREQMKLQCLAREEQFLSALEKQEIEDETEFLSLLERREEGRHMEAEIATYKEKITSVTSLVNHLQEETGGGEWEDTRETEQELQSCRAEKEIIADKRVALGQKSGEVKKILETAKDKYEKMQALSKTYGIVHDLDNLASGNNARRLVFEQYVLAVYFEQILEAANIRFRKMTEGRYEMFRSEEVTDGRTKDNLEIRVLDYYTGKARSVKTLSGGETFKASLSLALGLSDVIGRNNGGIQVDTLFVDEGFGALDGESLDSACETLSSLVERGRLIGIISHVPELRERIESQIVICKTSSGSRIENVIT